MNSERQILKRLLEGRIIDDEEDQKSIIRSEHHPVSTADKPNIEISESEDLDEKTYTVGNTQYWRRSGKCYSWTEAGGRVEIGEDEYMKAISGGKGDSPKPTEPTKDAAREEPTPIEQRRNAFYDDTESDHINYEGVKDFDHTTWELDGGEATIVRQPSGRGYYLQTEDYDEEFDTKGDLVRYLRNNGAGFAGYDSEKDY